MTADEPSPELHRRFDAALAARDRNDAAEAMRLLTEVVEDPAANSMVLTAAYGQLGYVSKVMLGDVDAAIGYFSRAVENNPTHELSSLSLFHALVQADRWTSAFEEAERFLTQKRSKEYEQLFIERYADRLPADAQDVFARIRALMNERTA